jgi:hypothetical protein
MTRYIAACGHDDLLGYFTNTPCKPCMIAQAKATGFFPTPDPTPPF